MDVVSLVVGAALGLLVSFFRPVAGWLERAGRALFRESPLLIHVESDPEAIWAGEPDWEPFSMYFRSLDLLTSPPTRRGAWLRWARANGGVDVAFTKLQVTLQAKTDVAVVVESVRVVSSSSPVNDGVVVTRPTGGADLQPRHFYIDLSWGDEPVVTYHADPSSETPAGSVPAIKLAAGDIERFQIWARANTGRYEWSLELLLLVEGRREIVSITNNGARFVTIGPDGLANVFYEPESGWRDPSEEH